MRARRFPDIPSIEPKAGHDRSSCFSVLLCTQLSLNPKLIGVRTLERVDRSPMPFVLCCAWFSDGQVEGRPDGHHVKVLLLTQSCVVTYG
jgi:hypothetical protein